eukprot:15357998-Ditylum_brightwellii.AAC.1
MEKNITITRRMKYRPCTGEDTNNEQTRQKRARLNFHVVSSSEKGTVSNVLFHVVSYQVPILFFFFKSTVLPPNSNHHLLLMMPITDYCAMEEVHFYTVHCPADAKEKDSLGKTPLHYACEKSASLEFVSLLSKACPEAAKIKDNKGMTPLHYECENGSSTDIVSLLLDAFPEAVMEKDDTGRTALHC